jgi:hypothetical protein
MVLLGETLRAGCLPLVDAWHICWGFCMSMRYDEAQCAKCGRVKCYRLLVVVDGRWQCANCQDVRRRPSERRMGSASQRRQE